MDTIVICSGGLDSVSLAHKVAAEHRLRGLLSFDYGQRHVKEVEYAAACAKRLGVPHKVVISRPWAPPCRDRPSPTMSPCPTGIMPRRR